jgi:hypothetical protein
MTITLKNLSFVISQQTATTDKLPYTGEAEWETERGRYRKDVSSLSPTRTPDPTEYHFTEVDLLSNHITRATPEKIQERVIRKYDQPAAVSSFFIRFFTHKKFESPILVLLFLFLFLFLLVFRCTLRPPRPNAM